MQLPILSDLTMRITTVHLRHCLQTKRNTIQRLSLQAQIKNIKSFPHQEQRVSSKTSSITCDLFLFVQGI